MTNAWKIAAALAAKSGLDWGRWASGHPSPRILEATASEIEHAKWALAMHDRGEYNVTPTTARWLAEYRALTPTPVPDPSDVEAYKADCARRGVEPGPLPSLSGVTPSGLRWGAQGHRVAFFGEQPGALAVWLAKGDRIVLFGELGVIAMPRATAIEIGEMARVAREAMR